jgi:hypothetical protein
MSERKYTSPYLSDVPEGTMIKFGCERLVCKRKGQYRRETLLAKYGDGPLPDLLTKVAAGCPRQKAITGARCGVIYDGNPLRG